MRRKEKEYLPHAVTVNEYFERLDSDELQKVQQKQVYGLIRSKSFYDARFRKKWLVIVDETQSMLVQDSWPPNNISLTAGDCIIRSSHLPPIVLLFWNKRF